MKHFIYLLCLLFPLSSFSQIRRHYCNHKNDNNVYHSFDARPIATPGTRIEESDIRTKVSQIKDILNLNHLKIQVEEGDVSNAHAVLEWNTQTPTAPCKRFIRYNPFYLRTIKKQQGNLGDWGVMGLLAHELVHHALQHTLSGKGSTIPEELEADEYAGYVLGLMCRSLEEALACLSEVSHEVTATHPSRYQRELAISKGWSRGMKFRGCKPIKDNMVFVKGGTFMMGCTSEQGDDCWDREKPAHSVTLSDFYIGKYEVSVQEFADFVYDSGYLTDAEKAGQSYCSDGWSGWYKEGVNWRHDEGGNPRKQEDYGRYPVIHVTWNDATAYCKWLSKKKGHTYHLPTEAEWEYAARGGIKRLGYKYAGSNTVGDVAWYDENSGMKARPIGKKQPNELGLYDMSGNVWEWCRDWYGSYSESSKTNPTGASSGSSRVLRGGSWSLDAQDVRVAYRGVNTPTLSNAFHGFRLTRTSP